MTLLKVLLNNGLKYHPGSISSLGHGKYYFIRKITCIKPLKRRLEAIPKLKSPKTANDCKSSTRVVNYFSMFCPNLQKLLKSIYDQAREGRCLILTIIH